ncbi:Efg1p [Sugiyamaella lignohabitans]|uniref:rRNA-processing protein EFG1 n=1 Tax=Sugiyamaella lignohabitans TaxID=796027 RepID=A0A161HX28_9ASCO|nr:Efg1p [Sugiyamaella lignohabitans]ANB14986.1 Efg1p [Sugiyamaella lignohabitans]
MAKARKPTEIQTVGASAGTSKIKKKMRDLERLLRKPDLDANKKVETERALSALKGDLETAEANNKQKTLAKKYHMVRFFERKKAIRRLNQAAKKLHEVQTQTDASPEDIRAAQKNFNKREAEYYYVVTFPMNKKYVALFISEEHTELHKQYLSQIKQQIKDKTLPSGLDAGKPLALQYRA